MTMYEQDLDVLRWGLHLLCGDPFSNSGYCGTTYPNLSDYYSGGYNEENSICTNHPSVEHDELIAHSLQEELSNLAIQDASEPSHVAATEGWFGPSVGTYNSDPHAGNGDCQNEENDGELSSSCSSPGENAYDGENWSLELADEYSALDGEVGMRLNQMVPVPHVPKINGEIPSLDEAVSDHQRLLDRLCLYDLVELKVQGDGNCQFRALSDQFYRTTEHHKFVRQQVINQLKSHPEIYEGYVPMEYGDYLRKLSKSGEWGDHVTLQAAADSYGVKIFVITSFKDTCYIEILPCIQKSNRVICLSFWAEVHYNSIYPEGDLPESETKKKRRWWHFKNKH